jgi:hypothetical protein
MKIRMSVKGRCAGSVDPQILEALTEQLVALPTPADAEDLGPHEVRVGLVMREFGLAISHESIDMALDAG